MKLDYNHIGYQIKVHNPEHSRAIQERVFELGYTWVSHIYPTTVSHTKESALVLRKGHIYYTGQENPEYTRITLDDLYNIETETSFQHGDYTVTHKEEHWYVSGPDDNFELPFETVSEMCKEHKINLFEKEWRIEHPNVEHAIAVRKQLKKMGFELNWDIEDYKLRTFHDEGDGVEINATSWDYNGGFPLITFDDLFESQPNFKVGSHKAIKNGDEWTIGCQTVPHSFVMKLKKYQDE